MIEEQAAEWTAAARPGQRIGHAVEVHARIGSTNDQARKLLERPGGEGTFVVAEIQDAGRGRRGRAWVSPPGVNLTASVGLRPRVAARDAWQLSLAVALAARDACLPHAPVSLKWPNDLVGPGEAKLGGILIETVLDGEALVSAVVGLGINVNWRRAEMPSELAGAATSLRELSGTLLDRAALLSHLAEALEHRIAAVEAGLSPVEAYRAACSTLGALVTVETPEGPVTGRARAIDDHGALLVEGPHGTTRVPSGELLRLRPAAVA